MMSPGQADYGVWMRHALSLAARGLGNVWPNPTVGTIIVANNVVVGRGWTGAGGRPHAETIALEQAGAKARGATMVVTLEPCAHHGKTPPCAESIIKAGISRVISATTDPDPRVSGKGHALLREAGIEVIENILHAEAQRLNEGFFFTVQKHRPAIALKIASSLDGKSATHTGDSKWITRDIARAHGHHLRVTHDAILTGIGTVLADDPMLTCRLPGLEQHSPVRVVVDSFLRIPLECNLVKTAKTFPTWVITLESQRNNDAAQKLEAAGVKIIAVPASGRRVDLTHAMQTLAQEGITRLLVEAGGAITGAMLGAGIVDHIYWFRAPLLIGNTGMHAVAIEHAALLSALPRFTRESVVTLGEDILETYRT